ncbi:helix-turn-helix transcriptional regulator [Lactobacillus sp. LL6]|uniref:helix-turn-helix domain-containing protein n=1 Tax=Lactobacillus sp. LL6 TaxID=2596827 RepID=UPI001186161F|nr:helix-turn-helix transcriptional regulator [Lactobacillus sp. LL6]TSO26701.1 helix-turn-helix transcriptional regulator [Lactobacillus sp. LL6]
MNENELNFGENFKNIRKAKKMSLSKVADGITSKSSLSEWENGKGKMSFEKVVKMLTKLYITPSEFVVDSLQSSLNEMMIEIDNAYTNDQLDKLKELYDYYSKNSDKYFSDKNAFILEMISANCYMALSGINLFSDEKQDKLENKVRKINNWYYEDVFFFNNSSFLLPAKLGEKMSLNLIGKIIQVDHTKELHVKWTIVALDAVLNSSFILLLRDYQKGKEVIKKFKKLTPILDRYGTQLVRFRFLECAVNYIKTKDSSEFENKFFPAIEFLSFSNYGEGLKYAFKQLKAVYGQ